MVRSVHFVVILSSKECCITLQANMHSTRLTPVHIHNDSLCYIVIMLNRIIGSRSVKRHLQRELQWFVM